MVQQPPPAAFVDAGVRLPSGPITLKIVIDDDEYNRIEEQRGYLWVFGSIFFKDIIINKTYTARFCAKWLPYALQGGALGAVGFVYDPATPPEYTGRHEEPPADCGEQPRDS
jgi:hypothetical protein